MKMAASVEVLCLNGRRQKVKITPNTKILQILDEVCSKQDFLPIEDYELKHGNKTLDVTLSVRYAGLPNRAKLELVKTSQTRTEAEVTVVLQLPSSERIQHTFMPSNSLYDILYHWDNQPEREGQSKLLTESEGTHPVCIYLRDEVVGQFALRNTSLRHLGLTGGKAVIRLIHRPISDETLRNIENKINQDKRRKERIAAKALKNEHTASLGMSSCQISDASTNTSDAKELCKNVQPTENIACEQTETETETHDMMNLDSENKHVDRGTNEEAMEVDKAEQSQVHDGPASSQSSEVTTAASQQKDALDMLNEIPGVSVIRPGQYSLTPQEMEKARQLAEVLMPGVLPKLQASSRKQDLTKKKVKPQPVEEFKFPEETKGKDLYQNELSSVNPELYTPCEREVVIYNIEETGYDTQLQPKDDLPDEFFEVTETDIRNMWMDMNKKLKEEENQPLMTSAVRKLQQEQKMSKYKRAIIRLQFPDKMVLQGVFRPKETVFALHKFVKEHLEDKEIPFYLYTAPPKCLLKDKSESLIEANLMPLCIVYFGSENQLEHYLSTDALKSAKTQIEGDRIVYKHMVAKIGLSVTSALEPTWKSEGSSEALGGSTVPRQTKHKTSSGPATNTEKTVPKWFKIGK